MTSMSVASSVSLLAHGMHYALVLGGVLGVVFLLIPHRLEARRRSPSMPRDEHDARILQLRAMLTAPGSLALLSAAAPAPASAPAPEGSSRLEARSLWLPIAVVSSGAAAGAHAAVGPAHLSEVPLFGLFFIATAGAQLAWAVTVLRRPSHRLLMFGAVGNAVLVGLWLLTRSQGLPLGLMPVPEAVGLWDLISTAWEVAVIGSCLAMIRSGRLPDRAAPWFDWHVVAGIWCAGSLLLLTALSLSGAGA